jgi:putative DNA primase/helicase
LSDVFDDTDTPPDTGEDVLAKAMVRLDRTIEATVQAAKPDRNDALVALLADDAAIATLAHAWRVGRARVEAGIVRLKKAGVINDLTARLRSVLVEQAREAEKAERRARLDRERVRLVENDEDAPTLDAALKRPELPPLAVPGKWVVHLGGIFRRVALEGGGEDLRHVAHRPLLVTGTLRDLETGSMSVHLEWPDAQGRGWKSEVVEAAVVHDQRSFVKLRNRGAPVTGHGARELAKFLDDLEAANTDVLPAAMVSSRMGFVGSEADPLGFLWGRRLITKDQTVAPELAPTEWGSGWVRLAAEEGRAQLADAFAAAGSLDSWKAAAEIVLRYPKVAIGLYASLATPFLAVVPEAPNLVVDWSDETSHGKTTTLRVAASVWGNPDERRGGVVRTWWGSTSAIEQLADMSQHLPLILDDTKRAQDKGMSGFVADIIYQVAAGSGRMRARPDGLRRVTYWRAILLSTGESRATSFTQDAGARARVMCIRGYPFGDAQQKDVVEHLNRTMIANHGHAGPLVVSWLLQNRERWAEIRKNYAEVVEAYASAGDGGVAARAAHFLGVLWLGKFAAHEILGLEQPDREPSILDLAAKYVAEGVEDTDRPAAALRSVYAWAGQHEVEFWERHHIDLRDNTPRQPPKGWAGRWDKGADWTRMCFFPDALERILSYLGHEPSAILESWTQRGWRQTEGKHLCPKVSVNGTPYRLVCIKRSAFQEVLEGGSA